MAARKKGLSVEQKRQKMLEIFSETQDVFQLKDLEKLGPKKGVISQSVKDIITSLVDDGLVNMEKIGSSNYFWSFPSQRSNQLKQLASQTQTQLKQLRARKAELEEKVKELDSQREEPANVVAELQEELLNLKKEKAKLELSVAGFRDFDPEQMKKYETEIEDAEEAVYRWTENVVSIRRWVEEKTNMTTSEFNKQFGIKDDFEDVELN